MLEFLINWLGTAEPFALWMMGAAMVFGIYMAWTIGANDVANAMGTSVGAGSLTFTQAIILAALMEFAGAVLAGSHVTDTVRKGMLDTEMFADDPHALIAGMVSALLAAAVWLHVATALGLPVSTTHSIVGAVVGFGLFSIGSEAVHWPKIGSIALSWVISPVAGGIGANLLFRLIRRRILTAARPGHETVLLAPVFAGLTVTIIVLATIYQGLANLKLDLPLAQALAISSLCGIVTWGLFYVVMQKIGAESYHSIERVERIFTVLQIMTAAYVAFAHGANDVANAVGPLAAVYTIIKTGAVAAKTGVPLWILLLGGVGIVIGLASWGYKVIRTVGKSITELTPTRGFCAEFATASVVLVCSKLGLPVSTTHTLVGSVLGVGLARGLDQVNLRVMSSIFTSWILTLPAAAGLTVLFYWIIRTIFGF